MEAPKKEYPDLLAALEPADAVTVLNDRVDGISRVNKDIAEWLLVGGKRKFRVRAYDPQERRKIEEIYSQSLRKLARKPQRDGNASMGIIQAPWQRIIESTESLAQSHEILARKIEVDAETPLRQYVSSSKEMQSVIAIQGGLASLAKDVDSAQKKADKKDKREKGSTAVGAGSSAGDANQQWDTQSQIAFERLQELDEARINYLRGVLTQFQTHEVDSIEQNRKPAELCLNALLNMETADEIKGFAASIIAGPRPVQATRRRSSTSNAISRFSTAGLLHAPPVPPPPRLTTDRSRPSTAYQNENGPGSLPTETPKKPGLKSRLGTVMGRRKNQGTPPATPAERMKKERNRTSFMPFRRGDSSKSQQNAETLSQLGDWTSPDRGRHSSQVDSHGSGPPSVKDGYLKPPEPSATNGASATDLTRPSDLLTPIDSNRSNQVAKTATDQPHELSVSPPSPAMKMDPISRAQQEASATSEHDEAVRKLRIQDRPIQEDETEAQQAMNSMASQLRLQAQSSGINRLNSSVRGRRDVRNTVFVPNLATPPAEDKETVATTIEAPVANDSVIVPPPALLDRETASPIKAPGVFQEEKMSDSTSVHSAQSLGALIHHPEMHEAGLNSSIVETVSTWFSNGTVSKSFVIGEVALAYNSSDANTESETIRLENFQVLEKIAPNPNFVTAAVSEKGKEKEDGAGEYTVAISAIKRSTPVVAFKYQIHLDSANPSAYSPVLITPAWQIQDTQASVIVVYTLNPAFTLGSSDTTSITLKNVVVSVNLDPSAEAGKATSAMMAPQAGGTFKRKQSLVVWKLSELVVTSEQQKLLARFVTTGPKARPGHVDAKWELSGSSGSKLGVSVLSHAAEKKSDPFADEGTAAVTSSTARSWAEVTTARTLLSGKYTAS